MVDWRDRILTDEIANLKANIDTILKSSVDGNNTLLLEQIDDILTNTNWSYITRELRLRNVISLINDFNDNINNLHYLTLNALQLNETKNNDNYNFSMDLSTSSINYKKYIIDE